MTQMKTEQAINNKTNTGNQQRQVDVPVLQRPGEPCRISHCNFLCHVVKIVLCKCGAKNKAVKIQVIQWKMHQEICFHAQRYCANSNKYAAE